MMDPGMMFSIFFGNCDELREKVGYEIRIFPRKIDKSNPKRIIPKTLQGGFLR